MHLGTELSVSSVGLLDYLCPNAQRWFLDPFSMYMYRSGLVSQWNWECSKLLCSSPPIHNHMFKLSTEGSLRKPTGHWVLPFLWTFHSSNTCTAQFVLFQVFAGVYPILTSCFWHCLEEQQSKSFFSFFLPGSVFLDVVLPSLFRFDGNEPSSQQFQFSHIPIPTAHHSPAYTAQLTSQILYSSIRQKWQLKTHLHQFDAKN